jgi:(p)ppGpp synthase/HD superfamily hydrolase
MIAGDYTDNEDVLIACLLHDTIEDSDYTEAELEEDFGGIVREIVEAVSEPQTEVFKKLPWREQKQHYIKSLKGARKEALIVAAADKIHNMRSIVEEYYDDHVRFMADFKGSLEDRVLMYGEIQSLMNHRLDNAIVEEFNSVFIEYKNFVSDVKKTKDDAERF